MDFLCSNYNSVILKLLLHVIDAYPFKKLTHILTREEDDPIRVHMFIKTMLL